MPSRPPRWFVLVAPFAATVLAATAACAQQLTLKLSREIEAPVRRGISTPGSATATPDSTAPRMIDLAGGALPQLPAPALPMSPPPRPPQGPEERGTLYLRADRLEGNGEQQINASGSVELRTRRETVLADWLQYDVGKDEIWAKGEVTLRRGLDWISGPEVKFYRDREIGYFDQPRFYINENGAHGEAKEVRFTGPDLYEATDAQYTSCIAPNNDWYLRSEEIEVDQLRKVGTARNAKVYFLGVPIAYTPWMQFPLSNERKSGFLTPTIGSTQIRGFEIAAPYYFNLAPNYDATVTPRIMTRRGLQILGQGRYLFDGAAGETIAEVVPDDRVTDTTRWALSIKHNQTFTPWLSGYINYNRVSDNTYLADYADRVSVTSQKTLPEEAGLVVNYAPFTVLARTQMFQTLQDPNPAAAVLPPYNMLPQIKAGMADTDWLGLTWNGTAEYIQFSQPALTPTGDRVTFFPSVRWTTQGNAWYVSVHGGVSAWRYDLEPASSLPPDGSSSVVVPIASLEAGLVFERDWSIFGRSFIQTLEPRAMYTYIPFKSQNQLPVFDTVLDDFNFTQLFSENR
ncbi:MAG: LPS assembly protein LptD, partial [Casimicrobiaceae bacterium]